jgi:hypothetical protein
MGFITGKITGAGSKNPVARASVFLSNASYGTASLDDGSFTLRGIKPGQYNLVVTVIGYEEFSKQVLVGSKPVDLAIELTPKVMMMRAVTITSSADWKKNYEMFKKDFIGTSENSKQCKVINPHILDLNYVRKTQTLEASSDEFLVVENYALGYRPNFYSTASAAIILRILSPTRVRLCLKNCPEAIRRKRNGEQSARNRIMARRSIFIARFTRIN